MKWHGAPLIRFLAIGAVLFGLHTLLRRSTPDEGNRVEVSLADIDRMRGLWQRQWRRPPTEKELEGLINQFIREEILYREAVAMGLDQNDTVIHRRLAQKMELLSNDLAAWAQPTEDEMQQYLEQKPERYGIPARISLSHVYMSRDRRGAAVEDDARHVLHKLRSKSISPGEYRELGDPFMLQYDYPSRSQQDLPLVLLRSQESGGLQASDSHPGALARMAGGFRGPIGKGGSRCRAEGGAGRRDVL